MVNTLSKGCLLHPDSLLFLDFHNYSRFTELPLSFFQFLFETFGDTHCFGPKKTMFSIWTSHFSKNVRSCTSPKLELFGFPKRWDMRNSMFQRCPICLLYFLYSGNTQVVEKVDICWKMEVPEMTQNIARCPGASTSHFGIIETHTNANILNKTRNLKNMPNLFVIFSSL